MASLYEIDKGILECIDFETGELIDPERLEGLQMARNLKIENIALWIKNLRSDAQAFKAEKDSFAEREKAANAKADSLERYLTQILDGEKFSTSKCAVSFRKSVQLDIIDEDKVPAIFKVQTVTTRIDKNAVKALLKDGKEVDGCRLIENQNINIK